MNNLNLKALPYHANNFLKYIFSGLSKQRGSTLFILLIIFLYFTWSFSLLYIKFQINLNWIAVNRIEKEIKDSETNLNKYKSNLKCYQNQLLRISNNEKIELDYCNKTD
jgi:hypothetical protein